MSRPRHPAAPLLGLAVVAFAAASCGGGEGPVGDDVVLGAILPLSGADARTGEEILAGLELACEGPGDGPHVILRVVDGAGEVVRTASRFADLSGDPEVSAVVAGWHSTTARTLTALSAASDVPLLALSPLASGREATPSAFALHHVQALGEAAAGFAKAELGALSAGVVRIRGSDVSRLLADSFIAEFAGEGAEVAWEIAPDEEGRMMLPPGPEVGVDVLYVAAPGKRAVQASGLSAKTRAAAVLTARGWSDGGLRELAASGVPAYVVSFFSPTDPAPASRRLLEACAGAGREPTPALALGWDAARLVRHAASRGGTFREAIQGALRSGASFGGATGRIEFPPGAPPRETPAVSSLTRGGAVFLRRVETAVEAGG